MLPCSRINNKLFILYEHTAELWNLMQDSLLFLGVWKHTLVLESLVGRNPTYTVALASFQSRFNGLRTSHFKWRRGLQHRTFSAQLQHIPAQLGCRVIRLCLLYALFYVLCMLLSITPMISLYRFLLNLEERGGSVSSRLLHTPVAHLGSYT
jgi:hypothetical protein